MSAPPSTDGSESAAKPLSPEEVRGLAPRSVYGREVEAVARNLDVDPDRGLTDKEAADRLRTYGPNKLAEAKKDSPLVMFLRQFAKYRVPPFFNRVAPGRRPDPLI